MSEFGTGLTYCLGLFLCHSERKLADYDKDNTSMWFDAAADHLYELEVPDTLPNELVEELTEFQTQCLYWRLNNASKDDMEWAIKTAKGLLMKIDSHFGIKTEEADWA